MDLEQLIAENKRRENNYNRGLIDKLYDSVHSTVELALKGTVDVGTESLDINSSTVRDSVKTLDNSVQSAITALTGQDLTIRDTFQGAKGAIIQNCIEHTFTNVKTPQRFTTYLNKLASQPMPKSDDMSIVSEGMYSSRTDIAISDLSNHIKNKVGITPGKEAWDGENFDITLTYNIVLNYTASEQNEFTKAFFPIIPIKALDGFFRVTTNSIYVMNNEPTHDLNGNSATEKFKRKSVIKSALDPETWSTNRDLLVPVYREESKDKFIQSLRKETGETGVTITTAPLLTGMDIDLIGISHDDQLAARGNPDYTDAIDRTVKLKYYYVEIKSADGSKTSIFKVKATNNTLGNFLQPTQYDEEKSMLMAYKDDNFILNLGESVDAYGKPAEIFNNLPADITNYRVRVAINLQGNLNAQTGTVRIDNVGDASVAKVYTGMGDAVPSDETATYNLVKTVIGSIKVIGYDLEAYRTNSNLRVSGKMLVSDNSVRVWGVPFHTAVSLYGPVSNVFGDENDINRLAGCLGIGNLYMQHDAVYQLLNHCDSLDEATKHSIGEIKPYTGSIAEQFVDPYYVSKNIHLPTLVDGVTSSDRLSDIRHALMNNIIQDTMDMGVYSLYFNAFDAFFPGQRSNMHVILGTDPIIAAYLRGNNGGEDLKLDNDKTIDIVASYDPRMVGKIIVTFTVYDTLKSSEHAPHPLAFGWCPWAPATVIDINRTINGATGKALWNILRFANIPSLPIVTMYTVTGINEVLGKLTIYTKEQKDVAELPGPSGAAVQSTPTASPSASAKNTGATSVDTTGQTNSSKK